MTRDDTSPVALLLQREEEEARQDAQNHRCTAAGFDERAAFYRQRARWADEAADSYADALKRLGIQVEAPRAAPDA